MLGMIDGADSRTRTCDLWINSPPLHQLSYVGPSLSQHNTFINESESFPLNCPWGLVCDIIHHSVYLPFQRVGYLGTNGS